MGVIFNENNYRTIRTNDPAYQAMTRVSDANNTYDVRQRYVKKGVIRNDFESQLKNFDNNKGILNDGLYIDMTNFFIDTQKILVNGVESVIGKEIPYFKFKTNSILNYKSTAKFKDTYIDKTKIESIYDIKENSKDGNTYYTYKDEKSLIENVYNSYPLQRVDKLVIHELDSLFIYIDGKKIPDNEVFIYSTKSATDIFIPKEYFKEDINATDSNIDTVLTVDYRQPGSEGFYYFNDFKSKVQNIEINITDEKYAYRYERYQNQQITKDKILVFVNGLIVKTKEVTFENNILNIEFDEKISGKTEVYILNNIIYRYKKPEKSMLNSNGSKVFFYLNDDYKTDIISGPITKSAVSFWYDGKRVDDSLILQNSRYSFELTIDQYRFEMVNRNIFTRPVEGENYYILTDENEYELVGTLSSFDEDKIYYVRYATDSFDEDKIEFFIEDIDEKVDDSGYKSYGDDYYLLNMLGVKRCVDKMKGTPSYSIFDDPKYSVNFKQTLSNNGELFDVQKAIDKYTDISYNTRSPNERIKRLITERPTLLRRLLEQISNETKRFIVIGNNDDITVSSVKKIDDPNQHIYYKIYVNHNLIESAMYSTKRDNGYDYITIKKDVLEPLTYNTDGTLKTGRNEIEMFQFDLSFKEKLIFKDNINNNFETFIEENGEKYYEKTYDLDQLPFEHGFLPENICAIELIKYDWFDYTQSESNFIYPDENRTGYRMVKLFEIVEKTDTTVRIRIKLHDYDPLHTGSNFFILLKEYNVVERITITNPDRSYMETNDLLIPVYSTYTEYGLDEHGNKIIIADNKYIPYINTSEPIITCGGKEMIYGKDSVFSNPEINGILTSSFIILKRQLNIGDEVVVQFNSNKTNILIVGYDDLEINNRYGLIYLSELKYPISTEYMNIYINGEKMSAYDIDILSDKLIRVHHMVRPIRSILITTNTKYKESEIQDFLQCYHESDFEKTLEEIFANCDPSKQIDANRPNIDFTYKVNPYYKEFVGDEESNYNNPYYKNYVDTILANSNTYNNRSVFSVLFHEPDISDPDYDSKKEAWDNAYKFFEVYKTNHGFVPYVDSVLQAENPYYAEAKSNFITDTLEIMYINWLCKSGKTRSYNFKAENIDPVVLKYFSVFENVIINDTVDIVVDSNRFYDGMQPDVCNDPYDTNPITGAKTLRYPGADPIIKRRYFFSILLKVLSEKKPDEELYMDSETLTDTLVQRICMNKMSNILYPCDQPLEPDRNGIMFNGLDYDIVNFGYLEHKQAVARAKAALEAKLQQG